MANEQHLEWLKEGVEAWNRQRQQDDFVPDLSGADLSGANLRGAILSGAVLSDSVLSEADFSDADLYGADLSFADLSRADLTLADISGADFRGANLTHANVQTEYSTADTNIDHTSYTYRNTMFLDQVQLDSMIGDSCSIIPNHLTRPAHWAEFEVPDERDNETDKSPNTQQDKIESKAETSDQVAYYKQLALNLTRQPIKTTNILEFAASNLKQATSMYRAQCNDVPDDLILIENISFRFDEIAKLTAIKPDETLALQDKIKELEAHIISLNKIIQTQADAIKAGNLQSFKSALIVAVGTGFGTHLGTGGAITVIDGVAHIFDGMTPYAAELLQSFKNLFSATPPPPPPPSMSV